MPFELCVARIMITREGAQCACCCYFPPPHPNSVVFTHKNFFFLAEAANKKTRALLIVKWLQSCDSFWVAKYILQPSLNTAPLKFWGASEV